MEMNVASVTIDSEIYERFMKKIGSLEDFTIQAELRSIALYEQQEPLRESLTVQSEFLLSAAGMCYLSLYLSFSPFLFFLLLSLFCFCS
jgi:hypothetical protein